MSEKIRTDSDEFRQAVARGDTRQLEEWDSEGRIAWNPRNTVGRALSEAAQAERQRQESEEQDQPERTERSRLDEMVGENEEVTFRHPLVQGALRRGDSQLLAEIYADRRYSSVKPSGPHGAFTSADIEAHVRRRDAS